jgi:N-acetylmuramoyl-L-alanine amidase
VTRTHDVLGQVGRGLWRRLTRATTTEWALSVHAHTVARHGKQLVNGSVFRMIGLLFVAGLWLCMPSPVAAQTEVPKTRNSTLDGVQAGRTEVAKRPTSSPRDGAATDIETAITAAQLRVEGARTILELHTTQTVAPQVFVLSQPDRVIIDVTETEFRLPPNAGQTGAGLVAGFRYGLVAAGRSRIVVDAIRPVRVKRSAMTAAAPGRPAHFEVELEAASAEWAPAVLPQAHQTTTPSKALPERKPNAKFVVMIDPGHGGIDGGAMSGTRVIEKDLTLAVARQLKAALDARQTYDVRLTRNADTFVSLDARVELSQAAAADLFISIHADSVGDPALARTAHGATIYTLSETASNQAAQQLAEKENAADQAGGLVGTSDADATQVGSILADLVKRETHNFSLQFKGLIIDRLRPSNMLARDPSRAAAFKVLRQIQTPTVLIELGFLTHEMDAQQMQTADWQKRIAGAIALAVDSYAARRSAAAR